MSYPKFADKHLEEALFHAKEFVSWKDYLKKEYGRHPKKYILIYYPRVLRYFVKNYHPKKIRLYGLITVYQHKDIGVVQMTGIGSPNAVTVFEELIALGGKTFLNIGSAGGLESFGVFLCERALRDEGTSYHCIAHGDYVYPDKSLTNKLEKCLKKNELDFQKATTWTIDAPYRETKAEIRRYKKLGIKTVEMEASALFAVAKVRKVKIAGAFVVSDILNEDKWNPQFHAKHVRQKLNTLFDAAVECLRQK